MSGGQRIGTAAVAWYTLHCRVELILFIHLPSHPRVSSQQVRDNVAAVLQGLGLEPSPAAEAEAAALAEVQQILAPMQGVTWPSGLPENN